MLQLFKAMVSFIIIVHNCSFCKCLLYNLQIKINKNNISYAAKLNIVIFLHMLWSSFLNYVNQCFYIALIYFLYFISNIVNSYYLNEMGRVGYSGTVPDW